VRLIGRGTAGSAPIHWRLLTMSKTKRFLSKAEVRDKVKLSYSEIARREQDDRFPKRLRLGNHRTSRAVWLEEDIDAWMDAQIAMWDATPKN
jgi:predicted DNA-binding transcriptional regulator AlpA